MTAKPNSRRHGKARRNAAWTASGGLALVVLIAVIMLTRSDTPALTSTGELNSMGMPIVTTPGSTAGEAAAGDIAVSGSNWALGAVPLNVSVQPSWTLRNVGDDAVTLGEPHPEVREGCCPGPLTLGQRSLAAGESTTLTFDLSMHEGMDGWHDIAVHVPVSGADEPLTLAVTADFGS